MKVRIQYKDNSVEYKVRKCCNYDYIIQLVKDHMKAVDTNEKDLTEVFKLTEWEKHPSKQ